MPRISHIIALAMLLGMCVSTACSTPPDAPRTPTPTIRAASVTPVPVDVRLQAPVASQTNLMTAFGATDIFGRAYPGWMLASEATTLRLTAMTDGVIVMSVPLLLGRTSFVRIQLSSERYEIEYVVAGKHPFTMPALTPRQQVHAGDLLYEVAIDASEYAAVSVVDRVTMMHVCPRSIIDTTIVAELEQQLHRRADEWCVAAQLPYTDSGLLIPIKGYEDATGPLASPVSTTPSSTATVTATPPVPTRVTTQPTSPAVATLMPTPSQAPIPDDVLGPLIYPVRDIASIRIMEAYSTDASAPWGFAHNGIDFMTDSAREPVIASANGTITRVDIKRFPPRNNWQINIALRVTDRYTIGYAIEPMRSDDATGQSQQALIMVSAGQTVLAGDVLGELIGGENGAHIHWGINDERIGQAVCPAPFLSDTQQRELLARIPSNPDRLCYP